MKLRQWGDKRFNALNHHLREEFGTKVFKVALNAGFTCPNRDGTLGMGGCAFCSSSGSGDFAGDRYRSISEQFQQVKDVMHRKWPQACYLGYLQAFTNTYGPVDRLRKIYFETLQESGVVGLAIGTRPDCLPEPVLELLDEVNRQTYLWMELGLQTIHPATARAMNLGYEWEHFNQAVHDLRAREIRVCPHIILGLPGETREMMMETARRVAGMDIQGLKIHLLTVLAGTRLEDDYNRNRFALLEQSEYVDLVVDILEILPPQVVIHRLTGDSPRGILVGPDWSLKKWEILNQIDRELANRQTWQGALHEPVRNWANEK